MWPALLFASATVAAASPFRFASMFGDNMVLQRDVAANVWGWAGSNLPIYASLQNLAANVTLAIQTTSDASGKWVLSLPAQEGGSALFNLQVSSDPIGPGCDTYGFDCNGISTTLNGIMFGDVVFCSGQSNMQVPVSFAFNSSENLQLANSYSSIVSIFQVQWSTASKSVPLDDLVKLQIPWTQANNMSLFNFSATCWYSGLAVLEGRQGEDQTIPLGLIASTWPGTAIKPWTSPAVNNKCMPLYPWNSTSGPKDCGMLHWPCNVSSLYNSMIYPFTLGPMHVASFIWYQGENDVFTQEYDYYSCQLQGMIQDWRQSFGSPLAHWATVQLAPYIEGGGATIAGFKSMQCEATAAIDITSCAVVSDGGDPLSPLGNIHSRNKQLTGRRVAAGILDQVYGYNTPSYALTGPTYVSSAGSNVGGDTLVVNITLAPSTVGPGGRGLVYVAPHINAWQNASRCPTELPSITPQQCGWFTITASDGKVYNATASLLAGSAALGTTDALQLTAVVANGTGLEPVATSWGYANWPVVNWYSAGGQPIYPWNATVDKVVPAQGQ